MEKFEASQFTATEWSTKEDKAKFANHFVRFVESDFKSTLFYQWFYNRLNGMFGHIAHYNRGGFYGTWFSSTENKARFLQNTLDSGHYGDPAYTYSDVEKVLAAWVAESGLFEKYQAQNLQEIEREERKLLARLQDKYSTEKA